MHRTPRTARVPHHTRRSVPAIGRGDRVVAVAEVTADTIRIHGFGVYDHEHAHDHSHADVAVVANALAAADLVAADLTPLVQHLSRHASQEWAERAQRRYRTEDSAHRDAPLHDRARTLLAAVPHRPRIRIDDGRSIDASGCFVMRAETFTRYATGTRVVPVNA